MSAFRPTVAAPGRLLRLGVVLDLRNRPDRLREVARMCDGAGIESLWTREVDQPLQAGTLDAWTAITLAAQETKQPTVGAVVSTGLHSAESLSAMASTLDAASGGRLELTISGPGVQGGADALEAYAVALRKGLEAEAVAMTPEGSADRVSAEGGTPRIAVEAADLATLEVAARHADDLLLPARLETDVAEVVTSIRAACGRAGRDPSTVGVALEAPVSIGRTTAEAQARAESEPIFRAIGQPAEIGVFGTLEQCQERVIELAHAGVTDLRCVLPNSPDIHDVIAQLTAMTIGSTDVLLPNAPRSKSPDPPEAWGGRAIPL